MTEIVGYPKVEGIQTQHSHGELPSLPHAGRWLQDATVVTLCKCIECGWHGLDRETDYYLAESGWRCPQCHRAYDFHTANTSGHASVSSPIQSDGLHDPTSGEPL